MTRPLADDHTIVTEGLKSILEPEFELVGTVEDGRAMLLAAEELQPDVIIADITMPSLNGLDAVRQLKKKNEKAKVVFLTMHSDADLATEAFRAGASGYLLKQSAGEELITAIHTVLKGQVYPDPAYSAGGVGSLHEGRRRARQGLGGVDGTPARGPAAGR